MFQSCNPELLCTSSGLLTASRCFIIRKTGLNLSFLLHLFITFFYSSRNLEESGRFTQELGISIERIRILRADWELKYLPVYSACFIMRPRGPHLKPQSWLVADLGRESVGLYLQSRFFSLQCSANEETRA